MKLGDKVQRKKGHKLTGVIVADFTNYKGQRHFVVEARIPEIIGLMEIVNADGIEPYRD